MRRSPVVLACIALAGCGAEDVGESGACAAVIVLHDEVYFGAGLDRRGPPAGAPVEGGIQPACNDSGPPYDDDREVALREVSGLPPEVAVYVEGDDHGIYVSERYHVFFAMPGYRRRSRGPRCRLAGTVTQLDGLRVGRRYVHVDGRTRMEGFPGSLPYVREGDRVRVVADGCGGESVVARRIALQP